MNDDFPVRISLRLSVGSVTGKVRSSSVLSGGRFWQSTVETLWIEQCMLQK